MADSFSSGQDIGGGYRLDRQIARSNFSEIWEVEGPGGVAAAAKICRSPLDSENAQRELDVLTMLRELRHPRILAPWGYWAYNECLIVITELLEGTLRDRLNECFEKKLPGIPLRELLGYLAEVAEAIDFMHSRNVVHRDVRPDHILLTQGHIKVTGLELATSVPSESSIIQVSNAGSPAYMAPEAWRGKVHFASDQYSLAATYVEMRLNRRLFPAKDLAELMMAQLANKPNLDPLPGSEQAALLMALAKDPAQRFDSCRAFVQTLADSVQH